jgi:3-hydroxyacyl-[acyl-carrier-protein] dehydratase
MISIVIPQDHPSFSGHFPGNPILPGVLLLERVMSYVQSQLAIPVQNYSFLNVKFLSAVSPGDKISLTLSEGLSNEKIFSIHIVYAGKIDEVVACTGKLRIHEHSCL